MTPTPNCSPEDIHQPSGAGTAPDAAVEGVSLPPNPPTLGASRPDSKSRWCQNSHNFHG